MTKFIIRKVLRVIKFRGCLQFVDNPIQAEDHTSDEFHLVWHPCRCVFEHGWPAFLLAFALTLCLLYPFASSCTCYIDDSNSSRYNSPETTRRHRPRKVSRWSARSPLCDTGRNTISCWGNLEAQFSSTQGNCHIFQSKNTSSRPYSQCNRCKICRNSYNWLPPLLKRAEWNKQQRRQPTEKWTSAVQNSWWSLKVLQPRIRKFWLEPVPLSSLKSTPSNTVFSMEAKWSDFKNSFDTIRDVYFARNRLLVSCCFPRKIIGSILTGRRWTVISF